jgi:exonuclease III
MRNFLLIFTASLIISACSNMQVSNEEIQKQIIQKNNDTVSKAQAKTPSTGINKENKDTVQKKVIKVEIKPSISISGKVVFTNGYCGGARPSKEMEEEFKKEFPLKSSTILLKNKESGKHIKINTGDDGNFSAELESGVYDYFMTEKYSKTMGASFRSSCDKWLKRCFGQLKVVSGKTKGYKLNFGFGCNPCEPPRP